MPTLALANGEGNCPGHAGCPGFPGWSAVEARALGPCDLLQATPATLSLATGGSQDMQLDAGTQHAGATYVVLGTFSGTSPGLPVPPYRLPLNPDAYFTITLTSPAPELVDSIGILNGSGAADAMFTLPAGASPGLAGLLLEHAFIVLDATLSKPLIVSNTIALQLLP